jgi:hypothetical protein
MRKKYPADRKYAPARGSRELRAAGGLCGWLARRSRCGHRMVVDDLFAAARFSLRFSLSVFWAGFLEPLRGFSEPFT